jgi:signal peptidase I
VEDIRYSEDVKDAITLANRMARKANHTAVNDRDYLKGLLLTHRKFNRLDALLTEMHVPVSRLKAALNQSSDDPPPYSTSDLLKNAEILAKANHQNGTTGKHPATVEVEHLLKAFCMSADPVVNRIVTENQLSPERIGDSVQAVKSKQAQRSILFFGKELVEVVAFVLFFLILIKSFLGELRLIPSESMVPGLQIGDRLVIERVTRWTRPYHRGDILVFYPPMTQLKNDPWSLFLRMTGFSGLMYKKEDNIDVAYIKRLIGTPGDIVNVKPGIGVFVNGTKLVEPYVNEIANTCTLMRPEPYCGPVKVPPGSYYMMGDNRNLSLDSRYWGFAREDRVIGRAVFRIWPPGRMGNLTPAPYQKD